MEALNFLKFWKPTGTTTLIHRENVQEIPSHSLVDDDYSDDDNEFIMDEGDDSFFELELTVSDFDNKRDNYSNNTHKKQQQNNFSTRTAGHNQVKISHPPPPPTHSMSSSSSSGDVLSKRKILPIEPPNSKPQSPISLLKSSAPRLRVSIFKKSKSSMLAAATEKTENSKQGKQHFTFKFKVEEVRMFNRASSLRKTNDPDEPPSSSSSNEASKRFSKDVIQKYLNLIKPLYVKVSKKNEKTKFSAGELLSEASPASSPAKQGNIPAGFRVVSRHLGKSKSASATASSPVSRRDDSLLLQHDGIQSAILHCKKSFNSARDSSSSDSSLSNLSSKDFSLSRFSSDSTYEESILARKSSERF